MTILQLCLSSSLGGLELYFLDTTLFLHQNTSHKVLALVCENSRLHEKIKELDIRHITLKKQSGKLPIADAVKIKSILKNEQIDLVHIHCKKDLPLAAWLKTFMGNNFKLVHTRQMNMPGSKKSPYHTFQYQKIDKLITITQKLHSDIQNRVNIDPNRIETLYYGVKIPEHFSQADFEHWTRTFEQEPASFRLAVFGNLNSTKAQHNIIEALGNIKNELPSNWKLYLIGKFIDPDYAAVIERKISENKLQENVVVTGFIDNAKQWMAGFDLIVLTTIGETFGLVLVEAMKSGVAVIGTDSEGVPEIIDNKETGILVQPNTISDLSDAILTLSRDENFRNQLATAGKKKANRLFDYERHYERLLQIYEELT